MIIAPEGRKKGASPNPSQGGEKDKKAEAEDKEEKSEKEEEIFRFCGR